MAIRFRIGRNTKKHWTILDMVKCGMESDEDERLLLGFDHEG